MKNLLLVLFLFLNICVQSGNSDKDKNISKTVSGTVSDTQGESIPGARLYIAETGQEFFADFEGRFQITLAKTENYTVTIESIGYYPIKISSSAISAFSSFSLKPL